MDIYISKKCSHCKKILMLFYNNKHLIQYFNIIDIEGISVPSYIQSVPTLTYNGELYYDDRLYGLIESVNQHHMNNSGQLQQPMQQQPMQQQPMQQQPSKQQPMQQQPMQQQPMQQQPQQKKEEEIVGICSGEDCLYENINENEGENNLMQQYCFLDEGYKEQSQKQKTTNEKEGKFDNNAYEAMMKSRGSM